jgi:hypothetical protein
MKRSESGRKERKTRLEHRVCRLQAGSGMQNTETIQCPFCGQSFELVIDTSVASQRFTTDCEVCCRPFEVSVECESGEVISVDVQGN